MSVQQDKKQKQKREARLNIIAKLYIRGWSMRQIREEVMRRLDLPSYSLNLVHKDIHMLLDQWREERLDDMDAALQLELERIDETCRELWAQWEKSKEDGMQTSTKRKANIQKDQATGGNKATPYHVEENTKNLTGLGNPAYIAEIRQQCAERRKLLGLYAPEKKDIGGNISFTSFLVESGMLDQAEKEAEGGQ